MPKISKKSKKGDTKSKRQTEFSKKQFRSEEGENRRKYTKAFKPINNLKQKSQNQASNSEPAPA